MRWRGLGLLSRPALALLKATGPGALIRLLTGHIGIIDFLRCLGLHLRLPLIFAGLLPDPLTRSIDTITRLEREFDARSTFFFIPFPHQPGHRPDHTPAPRTRACRYRLSEHADTIRRLVAGDWEIGLHGIDPHISATAARAERAQLSAILGPDYSIGNRTHWLYASPELNRNLTAAGYAWDSTPGSNHTIGLPTAATPSTPAPRARESLRESGIRTGASEAAPDSGRPTPDALDSGPTIPVLPIAIQDTALLRPDHMNLRPEAAWRAIELVLDQAQSRNAVVTVLWHNDSYLPPRCWDRLYRRLLQRARHDNALLLTAGAAVGCPAPAGDARPSGIALTEAGPADAAEMTAFHNRHHGDHRDPSFWLWEYVEHLPGKSVFLAARDRGRVVGTQGMIPINLRVGGKVVLTGKSEHSLIDPALRGQGLWRRMYQQALDACRQRGMTAVWGFTPVPEARRGLAALGFSLYDILDEAIAVLNVPAAARVIRASAQPTGTKLLATAGLPFLAARGRLARQHHRHQHTGYQLATETRAPDDLARFNQQRQRAYPGAVRLELDDDYLQWRLERHPLHRLQTRYLYYHNDVVACAVVNNQRHLRPVILNAAFTNPQAGQTLLTRLFDEFARNGAGIAMLAANRLNPLGRDLLECAARLGAVRRRARSVLAIRTLDPAPPARETLLPTANFPLPTSPAAWQLSLLWFEGYAT